MMLMVGAGIFISCNFVISAVHQTESNDFWKPRSKICVDWFLFLSILMCSVTRCNG